MRSAKIILSPYALCPPRAVSTHNRALSRFIERDPRRHTVLDTVRLYSEPPCTATPLDPPYASLHIPYTIACAMSKTPYPESVVS